MNFDLDLGDNREVLPTICFEVGKEYRELVFKENRVTVMERTQCYVRVNGAVNGRYHIEYWLRPYSRTACEFFTAKNKDKDGIPKVYAFYAEDVSRDTPTDEEHGFSETFKYKPVYVDVGVSKTPKAQEE